MKHLKSAYSSIKPKTRYLDLNFNTTQPNDLKIGVFKLKTNRYLLDMNFSYIQHSPMISRWYPRNFITCHLSKTLLLRLSHACFG